MGYFGSKNASGAFQTIIAQMPPHDTYIETHLGSGAVLQHKPPAARTIAIDRDENAMRSFMSQNPDFLNGECVCTDASAFLETFDFASAGRTLIYADPPYLWATRTSTKRYRFDYTHLDHVQLLQVLRKVPASVILSGYPHPLYDITLAGWRTLEFQAMTRGGVRTEKLWMNFEAGKPHWHSFAGRNFTERQMIKRKAERWATKFRKLAPAEKSAILAALHHSQNRLV